MKLSRLEFWAMNNPLRRMIQEKYELKIWQEMTAIDNIGTALEIGCGNGSGARLIKKHFSPKNLIAIDLDERMIRIAESKNSDASISFAVMDASKLEFSEDHFDAVFDFGIIHHIPNWKDCIREIRRVLKPGGKLLLEDLSWETFARGMGRLWKVLSDHPYDSMFTASEFKDFLLESGFKIVKYRQSHPLRLLRFFSLTAVKTG